MNEHVKSNTHTQRHTYRLAQTLTHTTKMCLMKTTQMLKTFKTRLQLNKFVAIPKRYLCDKINWQARTHKYSINHRR